MKLYVGWLTDLSQWFWGVVISIFEAIVPMVHDAFVWGLEQLLSLVVMAVNLVGAPTFLAGYSLNTLFAAAGPTFGWLATTFRIGDCLAIIGAGYAFRLVRKVLTLFQW